MDTYSRVSVLLCAKCFAIRLKGLDSAKSRYFFGGIALSRKFTHALLPSPLCKTCVMTSSFHVSSLVAVIDFHVSFAGDVTAMTRAHIEVGGARASDEFFTGALERLARAQSNSATASAPALPQPAPPSPTPSVGVSEGARAEISSEGDAAGADSSIADEHDSPDFTAPNPTAVTLPRPRRHCCPAVACSRPASYAAAFAARRGASPLIPADSAGARADGVAEQHPAPRSGGASRPLSTHPRAETVLVPSVLAARRREAANHASGSERRRAAQRREAVRRTLPQRANLTPPERDTAALIQKVADLEDEIANLRRSSEAQLVRSAAEAEAQVRRPGVAWA